jgi:hypothetical protein
MELRITIFAELFDVTRRRTIEFDRTGPGETACELVRRRNTEFALNEIEEVFAHASSLLAGAPLNPLSCLDRNAPNLNVRSIHIAER